MLTCPGCITVSKTDTNVSITICDKQLKMEGKQETSSSESKDNPPKLREESDVCLKSGLTPEANEFLESQEKIDHTASTPSEKKDEVNAAERLDGRLFNDAYHEVIKNVECQQATANFDANSLTEQHTANSNGSLGKHIALYLQNHFLGIPSKVTLRAVGFSYASRERNHCEQPFDFPSSMRELRHVPRDAFVRDTILETTIQFPLGEDRIKRI